MACPLLDVQAALARFGPERCEAVSPELAIRWCRELAWGHYENFTVVSGVVPADLRDDFGAVYAFCRWSDDLGDEFGPDEPGRAAARFHLAWWRGELDRCFAGEPRHPVFLALLPTIRRHGLPAELFHRLISAFELDQVKTRYGTWDELLDYCRASADPVGRLVLMLLGEPRDERLFRLSDLLCTALQLTNHWQDIRRDLAERDRIYVPAEMNPIARFEERLRATAGLGHSCDATFFAESRALVRSLVDRTWPLYEEGRALLDLLHPRSRPIVWLLAQGGARMLNQIEFWNYETVLHRPYLSKWTKLLLVARARLMALGAGRAKGADAPIVAGGAA